MWRLHVLPLLVWVLSTTYDWKWGPWKRNFITYQCGFDSFCVSSCQYCDWQAISKECNSPTQLFLSKVRMRGIKSGWKEVERLCFFSPTGWFVRTEFGHLFGTVSMTEGSSITLCQYAIHKVMLMLSLCQHGAILSHRKTNNKERLSFQKHWVKSYFFFHFLFFFFITLLLPDVKKIWKAWNALPLAYFWHSRPRLFFHQHFCHCAVPVHMTYHCFHQSNILETKPR